MIQKIRNFRGVDRLFVLTVVVPTFNERDNIDPLLWRLERALEGISWEVIFVDDDSSDGTADFVRAVARINARVRIIHRIGRRGLSSACVEGVLSSSSGRISLRLRSVGC